MKNNYFIDSEEDFNQYKLHIDRIFNSKSLPDNIFNEKYNNYLFFVFEDIFTEEFFNYYNDYLKENSFKDFIFYTLKPNPKSYFFENYNFYNVANLPCELDYQGFNELINNFPKENIADSLRLNANEFVITSIPDNLFFYCNRDLELGIVISDNKMKVDKIKKDELFNRYDDIKDYAQEILMLKYGERAVPAESIEFYSHLVSNFLEFGSTKTLF